MKRLLVCVSLVAATTTAALSAAPPASGPTTKPALAHKKAPPIRVAPADEYFGKLKMSVLGIRNTIKDVGANLDIDQTRWTQLAGKAAFAEDAMRDWQRKYPQDTWLAKTVFALERMYAKLNNDDGRKRSLSTMMWLVHDFPKTWYGRTGRTELAQGKVGKSAQTAAAAASPLPASDSVAGTGTPATAQGADRVNGTTNSVTTEQTSSAVAATPDPNVLPSIAPARQHR